MPAARIPDFEIEITIPPGFQRSSATEAKLYESPSGSAELLVTWDFMRGKSVDEMYADDRWETNQRRVVYKTRTSSWYVVSGYTTTPGRPEKIFYSRVAFDDDRWARFDMDFNKDERARYEPLLKDLGKSFRIGKSPEPRSQ